MRLIEWRRNPEVNTGNRWKNVVDQIEPYFGREDAFISMIDVPKIGIPPKTEHSGTPTAIYTYPLASEEICKAFTEKHQHPEDESRILRLPYKHWSPYVALILAEKTDRWFTNETSEAECESIEAHLDHIMAQVLPQKKWQEGKILCLKRNTFAHDFPASHVWSHVHLAASLLCNKNRMAKENNLSSWGYIQPTDFYHYMLKTDLSRPPVWNTLWRKLGYDVLHDMGTKMIYNLEPYQTAFLSKRAITNYQLFRNGRDSTTRGHKMEVQSAAHLFRLIEDGTLNPDAAFAFFDAIVRRTDAPGIGDMHKTTYVSYNHNIRLTPAQIKTSIAFMKRQHGPWVDNLLDRHTNRAVAKFIGYEQPYT